MYGWNIALDINNNSALWINITHRFNNILINRILFLLLMSSLCIPYAYENAYGVKLKANCKFINTCYRFSAIHARQRKWNAKLGNITKWNQYIQKMNPTFLFSLFILFCFVFDIKIFLLLWQEDLRTCQVVKISHYSKNLNYMSY